MYSVGCEPRQTLRACAVDKKSKDSAMTLHVRTAQLRYRGDDRFDITRKSGGKDGHPFAPSWSILGPALKVRQEGQRAIEFAKNAEPLHPLHAERVRGAERKAARLEQEAWDAYVPAYLAEMRQSKIHNFNAWRDLLARERVCLVCYCRTRTRCHRGLLAQMLVELGAVDDGEVVWSPKGTT